MSVGPREGTLLAEIEAQWRQQAGDPNRFHFHPWVCAQMRALKASMGGRYPSARHEQEAALLAYLRGRRSTNTHP